MTTKSVLIGMSVLFASCGHQPESKSGWQLSGNASVVESLHEDASANSVLFENAEASDEGGTAAKFFWLRGSLRNLPVGEFPIVLDLRGDAILGNRARSELEVRLNRRTLLRTEIQTEGASPRMGSWYHRVTIPLETLKTDEGRFLTIRISIPKSDPESPTRVNLSSMEIYWGQPAPKSDR